MNIYFSKKKKKKKEEEEEERNSNLLRNKIQFSKIPILYYIIF
jgi:hypothetical protein